MLQRPLPGRWLLFPFLLPLFFVLHAYTDHYTLLPQTTFSGMAGMYLGISLLLFGVAWILVRNRLRAGFLSFLLMTVFLYWGNVADWLKLHSPVVWISRLPVLALLMLALIAGLYRSFTNAREATRSRITLFLNSLFLIYLSVDAVRWLYISSAMHAGYAPAPAAAQKPLAAPTSGRPDIYLLLMDEYMSSAALKEYAGYDNSSLDSFLLQSGFSIQKESRANYSSTFLSIASLLNMDYIETLPENGVITSREIGSALQWIRHNKVCGLLEGAGYRISNRSIFTIENTAPPQRSNFVPEPYTLLSGSTLFERLRTQYVPWTLRRIHGGLPVDEDSLNRRTHDAGITRNVAWIAQQRSSGDHQPAFVYAHFLIPHDPVNYDSSGQFATGDEIHHYFEQHPVQAYLDNVVHANIIIRRVIASILKRPGPRPVILLLGDHGCRTPALDQYPMAKFRNLNAVYFPDGNYSGLYDSISNVNLFRVVFNSVFAAHEPLLPDRCVRLTVLP